MELVSWHPGAFNHVSISVSYTKPSRTTKCCVACRSAFKINEVNLAVIRLVNGSKFPARKSHWYHFHCVGVAIIGTLKSYANLSPEHVDGLQNLDQSHQRICERILNEFWLNGSVCPYYLMLDPKAESVEAVPKSSRKKRKIEHEDEDYVPGKNWQSVQRKRFAGACRLSIRDAMVNFKQHYFEIHADADGKVLCELTGEKIEIGEAHIDHQPPATFDKLVHDFVREYAPKTSFSNFIRHTEFVYGQFFDLALSAAFFKYHQSHCQLRVVQDSANMKAAKRRKPNQLEEENVIPDPM